MAAIDLFSGAAYNDFSNIEHLSFPAQGGSGGAWMITKVNIALDERPVSATVRVSILSCDSAVRGRPATNITQ